MQFKVIFIVLLTALIVSAQKKTGKILRKPKIYNAVITTDDNLAPSRAFPVIQPIIHETPITYSYTRFNAPSYYDYSPYYTQYSTQPLLNSRNSQVEFEGNLNQNFPPENRRSSHLGPAQNIPIPQLNRYPIGTVPAQPIQNPYNLQPYPQQSYPIIYDPIKGYQVSPLLPPYQYPSPVETSHQHSFNNVPPSESYNNAQDLAPIPNDVPQQIPPLLPSEPSPREIINYTKKNKDIPDVPPPPLPTAKKNVS